MGGRPSIRPIDPPDALAPAPPAPHPLVPQEDDDAMVRDLRHRLAVRTLESVADRDSLGLALRTLEFLAREGTSERVRHAAARDLARFAREAAHPPGSKVTIDARGAILTAGDLIGSVPPEALRRATARALAAADAEVVEVVEALPVARVRAAGGGEQHAGGGEQPAPGGVGGSEPPGPPVGEGYPPSESDRPGESTGEECPW